MIGNATKLKDARLCDGGRLFVFNLSSVTELQEIVTMITEKKDFVDFKGDIILTLSENSEYTVKSHIGEFVRGAQRAYHTNNSATYAAGTRLDAIPHRGKEYRQGAVDAGKSQDKIAFIEGAEALASSSIGRFFLEGMLDCLHSMDAANFLNLFDDYNDSAECKEYVNGAKTLLAYAEIEIA